MKKWILFFILILTVMILFGRERGILKKDYFLKREKETETTWNNLPNWATDSLNVKGIARIPFFGNVNDLFVVDTFAYVCMDFNLVILNISNKTTPQLLGYFDFSSTANGVYVLGNYAYIVTYDSGFRIIDISNPSSPTEVGYYDTPGNAYGVCVTGGYAYVADGDSGLRIIDISIPTSPSEVGYYNTPDWATDVYVSGGYAYVADGSSGLRIIDVSTPTSPSEVGYYDTPDWATDVYVSGGYAYVADGFSGLRIIDVSNPLNPYEVGYYGTPGNAANKIYIVGTYAYVSDGYAGLRIIDITDQTSPIEVGYFITPDFSVGIYVLGNYAYVGAGLSGFRIINISNPSSPTEVGSYSTPTYAEGVYVVGNYLYVAAGWEGLGIIDVSDPLTPIELKYYDTTDYAIEVYVLGAYAYVADNYYGLRIIDISNPTSPTQVGYYDTPGYPWDVYVSGSYAYVADADRLRIIDISNPTNPTEVGYYDTPAEANGVYVSGSYAYVANLDYGLRIIDISNPTNPTEVGYYDTPGYAYGVHVLDSYAYVADGSSGLRIINITNPTNPAEVGYYDTPGYAWDLYVSGDYAYVADGNAGLITIDISNPTNPTQVGYYNTPGETWNVYVLGSYIYCGDWSGVYILQHTTIDTVSPSVFNLISPKGKINNDTPTYIWNKSYDTNFKEYRLYVNNSLKVSVTDTTYTEPTSIADGQYIWYVIAVDSVGNIRQSNQIDTFKLEKMPVLSKKVYDFGDLDTNSVYNWRDLYIRNFGTGILRVDSVRYSNTKFFADTTYTYPFFINPGDSIRYGTNAFSVDTGMMEGDIKFYMNIETDTVFLSAHFGKPLRIDSAIAFDGSIYGTGIDADDYVVLYFNQPTNGFGITSLNIDNILKLSSGHRWTDGVDQIDTSYWNSEKTLLTIELSTNMSVPTISVGDTIYPDSSSIIGTLNSFRCHYQVLLKGSFVSGLQEKDILGKKKDEYKTYLEVKQREIIYSFMNEENEFIIYDILGKVIHKETFAKRGIHRHSIENLTSGIYFVKMKDKDKKINKKIVIMK
ncbi:MAG: T9SS type A sorting domain-containing protein [candidate division WOR-3 bacterium]